MNASVVLPIVAASGPIAYLVFNSAVNAMLPPEEGKERTRYGYFYRFFHGVAQNADKVVPPRFPSLIGTAK